MVKRISFFLAGLFLVLTLYSVVNFAYPSKKIRLQQENHPPVVKIISPKNNILYKWDEPLNYTITVSDQEDGESKYEEIPSNEVFLEVRYLSDTSKVATELISAKSSPPGLAEIRTSNCLNCHALNTKLIGPSFSEINKRYSNTKTNKELLEKHIREGSTGVWGKVTMPTHQELTIEETQKMVDWIFKNGAEQNVSYYRGTEGSFRIKPPVAAERKGVLVLIASYTDHGTKDKPQQNLRGQDAIILKTGS
jgi:cytochrome c